MDTKLALKFRTDQRGVFALWLAIAMIPLMLLAGAGLDLMRAVSFRSQLQAAADSAALAGATAYTSSSSSSAAVAIANTYMASAVARITGSNTSNSVSYTATPGTVASGGTALYTITVAAQGMIPSTLMKMWVSTTPVRVIATAQSPTVKITFTLSSFASNAADADAIYYYTVPSDGSVPSASALNLLYSNTGNSRGAAITTTVAVGQKIGFALKNVTGGIIPYGLNGYLGFQGTTHWFYSHLMPPSSKSYTWLTQNCSLQTVASGGSGSIKSGSCFTSLPSYATINCSQAPGKSITYYWNDMGGLIDDKDYNDAVFVVTCSGNPSATRSNVVLTK